MKMSLRVCVIPYGTEPDPVSHIQALAEHHQYYTSGISDILTIDETVKSNPEAMYQLCKGALAIGFREFTANVHSNDLVQGDRLYDQTV